MIPSALAPCLLCPPAHRLLGALGELGLSDDVDLDFTTASLGDMVNLTRLDCNNTGLSGDIANLPNAVGLTYLNLSATSVSGDIANLPDATGLTHLYL